MRRSRMIAGSVAALRAYREFWAENRFEGYVLFATISMPLGGAGK